VTPGTGLRVFGAVLCLAVASIHVIDQGGLIGSKDPHYVAVGYWLLEVVALLITVPLVLTRSRWTWFVAAGVAAGPFIGYVLSRGPGLPDYTDDKGNWLEPLGVVSLLVEAVLFALAGLQFVRDTRRRTRHLRA
jgi:hypothetical protein